MSISFINRKSGGGGGGGDNQPNIFVQLAEPTKKQGIWLQTNKTVEHYVSDDNVYTGGNWEANRNIPYQIRQGECVSIGTNIYLLGSFLAQTNNYKYDTLTNTYTKMTDLPYNFYNGSAISVGTDIYIFGFRYNDTMQNYVYKYDTLTDTYTQLTNIPVNPADSVIVAIGTDIYLCGYNYPTYYNYKYDTLTDTYTKLTATPVSFLERLCYGYWNKYLLIWWRY